MQRFEMRVPPYVVCGDGAARELCAAVGRRSARSVGVLVDAGVRAAGAADDLLSALRSVAPLTVDDGIPPEPCVQDVLDAYGRLYQSDVGLLVAIGGGSVLDTAKLLAVLLENPDYAGDLTDTARIRNPGVPLYVAPTSAGTGSEATPNAIVLIPEKKVKQGIVHDYFLPDKVFLDPLLTRSMPPAVTAATGLDAFCHCMETYISRKCTPFSELFSLAGIRLICASLRRAYADGDDMQARADMLLASFYGGVAIAASSTVAVHALSYPLGGRYHIPHGVSNAILLPHVMAFNLPAIGGRLPAIAAAMSIGADVGGEGLERAVTNAIFALCADLGIPRSLRPYGIGPDELDSLARAASEVRRLLDQNPREMHLDDIKAVYAALLQDEAGR